PGAGATRSGDTGTGVATALSDSEHPALSGRLPIPNYDRRTVSAAIVHIGVGGFHPAHQAMYLDRLMNAGAPGEWGICGVGVMTADREMQHALEAQDHLY